ncbi:MAG: ABC transporter substrate-binding protein [Acetobacteraceae bacterium]
MIRARALCATLMALLLAGPVMAAPDQALIDAARKEGQVVWYSTLIVNQILRPMVEAFQTKYPGIEVQYSRQTNSDVALKILNESRARRLQADLFDGTNSIYPVMDAKLIAEYRPEAARSYPAELKDPQGRWTAMNVFFMTTSYNTNLVTEAEAPKTYDDLLDAKWKGKIVWTNDPTSQGPPGFIHNILTLKGQEQGMEYLKRFAEQQPVFIPASQRVVMDKVIAGEYPIGVMTFNHHAAISGGQGAPVRWIKMEPLLQTINLLALLRDAPHPNAARLLIEFILSDEGQKVFADHDYVPASPSVPARVAELKPDVGKFRVNVVTPDMGRYDLPKWTAIYRDLFR